jgi:murein tripeptide amidase MpaA
VREAQDHETGVDMFFDIHGDEALPYNFVAGSEMLADFTPERLAAQNAFIERYMAPARTSRTCWATPPASTTKSC